MMRRSFPRRGLLALALTGVLLSAGLSGCVTVTPDPPQTEETTVDFGDVSTAVTAAVPRVVDVRDPARSQNGTGHRFSLGLVSDSAAPFTADELDAVVEAIWQSLPWEPNTIKLTAGADTEQGREAVDLRDAAAQLEPLGVTNAGQGGVSLTDMNTRYGEWTAPE